jgi:predicted aspartyl protease
MREADRSILACPDHRRHVHAENLGSPARLTQSQLDQPKTRRERRLVRVLPLAALLCLAAITAAPYCALSSQGAADWTYPGYLRIKYMTVDGHIMLPVTVSGPEGTEHCLMMLDTGASCSVLPLHLVRATGSEQLEHAPTATFSTAKGPLTCAMVERVLSVHWIESRREVAVSKYSEEPLLGVDFFEGRDYLIDSRVKVLYVREN